MQCELLVHALEELAQKLLVGVVQVGEFTLVRLLHPPHRGHELLSVGLLLLQLRAERRGLVLAGLEVHLEAFQFHLDKLQGLSCIHGENYLCVST